MKPDLDLPATELAIADVRKPRRCLMCGLQFPSEWSGERVCRKCKTRSMWRGGVKSSSG